MTRRSTKAKEKVTEAQEIVTHTVSREVGEDECRELQEILEKAPVVDLVIEGDEDERREILEILGKALAEPDAIYEVKLSIYEKRILDVPAGAAKVVIENVGGGDLYVDTSAISYNSKALITIGQSKEFSGVSKLFVSSASRPTFRVSIFK